MNTALQLLGYGLVAFFGVFLSAGFSGVPVNQNRLTKLIAFTAVSLTAQCVLFYLGGLKLTQQLYPLLLHLPLVLLLVLCFQRSWPVAMVSVLLAYLCCQIPRWIASVTYLFSENALYYNGLYILVISLTYAVLHRHTLTPIQKIMHRSTQAAWGLGILPLLYYSFDYLTTIYTDVFYRGNAFVVQMMPSVMAVGYILFLLLYQTRMDEQDTIYRERQLLSVQLRRSQAEYAALCQMQDQTNQYYHDLRHHTALLMDYAEKGALPEIKAYLQEIRETIDVATFRHFCGHPVADLLLSHFDDRANRANVRLAVTAQLPPTLPFKDTELCSLLSNSLENAVFAASQVTDGRERTVTVSLSVRQRNLLLSIQNPYQGDVIISNGLPQPQRPGHGLGTRGIVSIVNQYGGLIRFSATNGTFLLQASLPMQEQP